MIVCGGEIYYLECEKRIMQKKTHEQNYKYSQMSGDIT